MTIISRAYQPNDLARLQAFVAQAAARTGRCGYLHSGDIPHHLFNVLKDYDPADVLQVWEDQSGYIVGWALIYPRFKSFNIQVHPGHRGGTLENEIIDWSQNSVRQWMAQLNLTGDMGTDVSCCDTVRSDLLKQRGFSVPELPIYIHTERGLHEPIPEPILPEGFIIRSAAGEHEAGALSEVHAGAFQSNWTAEKYLRVMRSPGYDAEREMVVVAPDGRFAAFCIYWLDRVNKTVLFEPVGVHQDFQRRGLGRTLMYYVMRMVKVQGIETAIVLHKPDNEAAAKLYASIGFQPIHQIYFYTRNT